MNSIQKKAKAVVLCSNGIIAAWHPKEPIPYEHSRPIDMEQVESERKWLHATHKDPERMVNSRFGERGPGIFDLREIFYTTKHEWCPRFLLPRMNKLSFSLCKAFYFGKLPYLDGLRIQTAIVERVKAAEDFCHCICMFEHNPVYTGLREHLYSEAEEHRLKQTGAEFHRTKRGGLITFHGPGQLVVYPIFNLRLMKEEDGAIFGVRRFVNLIEESLITLLSSHFGIQNVSRTKDPGVWVDGSRKIAAIGIQMQNGITSHGLALNCNTDLRWFEQIVPCGLEGKSATSISKELGKDISIDQAIEPLCEKFEEAFAFPVKLCQPSRGCVDV